MPPATRRRDGATSTTRCIMNVLSEDNSASAGPSSSTTTTTKALDHSWDKNHLTLVLQDLQESLESRLTILRLQTSKAKDAQKHCWMNATVKIRKSVKEMTVKECNLLYKCDLLKLLQEPLQASNKRRGLWNAMATPAPSKPSTAMNTVTRTVKRGEAIL